MVLYQKKLGA
ncbi:hypothetical protein CUMW_196180 [Citrus unshiu]|nr:hypothetical protein CUMW_196180 [Citrus unshiu]